MHELSLVMSIIEIATDYAQKANASSIDEIELDIGEISNVEMNALDFAWSQGVKNTLLQHAVKKINHLEANAICIDCDTSFHPKTIYDNCPNCEGHFINIVSGKEFRVKSLLVS